MKIQYVPKFLECQESWSAKTYGAILVNTEDEITPLFNALCEQDDYWEDYKKLIKVAPKVVDGNNIDLMCEWCGKTDIYDVAALKQKMAKIGIYFILYQTNYWD